MSGGRACHASAAFNGKLYVLGGWAPGADRMDVVEVYSPVSNSWARAVDLPSAIDEAMAVVL